LHGKLGRGVCAPLFCWVIEKVITEGQIKALVEQKVEGTNIFIVNVKVSGSNAIKVEVDSDDGLSIDKCVEVSRHIEGSLDREKEDFELSVTSPGADQPLKLPRQYIKHIGRDLKVLKADQGKVTGKLIEANEETFIVLETRKERLEGKKKKVTVEEKHEFAYNQIKEAKVVISFK